jgi:putative endonuclease
MTTGTRRWWVYLIINTAGRSYVGVTFDASPARRLAEHNGAGPSAARSTRGRGPWSLAYAEEARDRAAALSGNGP